MTNFRTIPMTLVLLAVLAAPAVLSAQQAPCDLSPCTLEDSLEECLEKLAKAEAKIAADPFGESISQESMLRGLANSSTPSTNPNTSGAVVDLLPSFLGAVGIDGLGLDEGNLTFDKVFDIEGDWKLSVGATAFASSEIYGPLENALKESLAANELSTVTSSLEKEIQDFDKVDFKALIAKQRGGKGQINRWGRDTDLYADLLDHWKIDPDELAQPQIEELMTESAQSRLFESIAADASSLGEEAEEELVKFGDQSVLQLQKSPQEGTVQEKGPMAKTLAGFSSEARCAVVTTIRQRVSTPIRAAAEDPPLNEKQLKQLQSMIGNQPQAFVEWVREERSGDVLGPRSTNVRACYEVGVSGNINDFLDWAAGPDGCKWEEYEDEKETYDLPSLECLKVYLKKGNKAPETQHRVAFALAYESQGAYEFDLTDEAFDFALPEVDKTVASLVYGRYFPKSTLFAQGEQGTRVDLELKYEDPSQEEESTAEKATTMEAEERFVATLTFSQRLAGRADLSVSLVYANEPEFLGMVDEEVTANFGIKWSTKPKVKEKDK